MSAATFVPMNGPMIEVRGGTPGGFVRYEDYAAAHALASRYRAHLISLTQIDVRDLADRLDSVRKFAREQIAIPAPDLMTPTP